MIKIIIQLAIIQEIKKGIIEGIYNGERWNYSITPEGKHLLWIGRSIADITKRVL
jgi:predicted transcriptional regulator